MEYVEPLIPDYISDNPLRNMKNDNDFFEGFDLPGDLLDENWDEGFDLPGDSLDEKWEENEEGDEEKQVDQGEGVKSEDVQGNVKQYETEDEKEDPNHEDFDFDGPWNDSESDDLLVADPQKDTKVESPPVHGLT